jgi:nitrate reductase beta subunit
MSTPPVARPHSMITGEVMEKPEWGPNWEEILGGEFRKRSKDYNFKEIEKQIYGEFENTCNRYLRKVKF